MSLRFGFEVEASFESFNPPTNAHHFETTLGVLMSCQTPLSRRRGGGSEVLPEAPDFRLYFLTSNRFFLHSTLLDACPYPYDAKNQPTMYVPMGLSMFKIAARYALFSTTLLDVGIMIGSHEEKYDVRRIPDYPVARHRIAVACAQAVLGQVDNGDNVSISLTIVNNFEYKPLKVGEEYQRIGNLQQFNDFLRP